MSYLRPPPPPPVSAFEINKTPRGGGGGLIEDLRYDNKNDQTWKVAYWKAKKLLLKFQK